MSTDAQPQNAGHKDRPTLECLLDDVLTASAPLSAKVWGFGVGGFLLGLLRAGVQLQRPELVAAVLERVRPELDHGPDPTDHLIPAAFLRALHEAAPEIDVTPLCRRFERSIVAATRLSPDQPQVHRPDLPVWHSIIWVDCLHTDGPGLAMLGRQEAAVRGVSEYAAVLQRPDGLFQHGYDVLARRGNGVAWGRGQAWALQGLVDTLDIVGNSGLNTRLHRLVAALAEHESDGRWHTVVDDPASPIENSVAAYMAWILPHAIERGLADRRHLPMAARARESTLNSLRSGVLECSDATPVGPPESYARRGNGAHPWGQAPVLHLLLDEHRNLCHQHRQPTESQRATASHVTTMGDHQ